ncbi:MAG: hypothetical protein J1G02_04465 [Clostridiales bacterium]|nr:hypothetical protein [Clostridiales bacterium]
MVFNKQSALWKCNNCGYHFSEKYFLDDCVFWFCDQCGTYLNNQEDFERGSSKHVCRICGYENDTVSDNIKGICVDCGKILSNSDATLCSNCRKLRCEKAKQWLITEGKIAAEIGVVVESSVAASPTVGSDDTYFAPSSGNHNNDEVYGLGEGNYPTCKTCGEIMTEFDGWAWYTCHECGNKVRIIEGKETWRDEIFGKGKKQHKSDFELANLCRGGDLKDD